MKIQLDLRFFIILSTLFHLITVSPVNRMFLDFSSSDPLPDLETSKIEFDFFQATPRLKQEISIPRTLIEPQSTEPTFQGIDNLLEVPMDIPLPNVSEPEEEFEFLESDEIPEETSFEEKEEILKTEDDHSDSLLTEVELNEKLETQRITLDYCGQIRRLIENNSQLSEDFVRKGLTDIVQVEISLNKKGQLIHGTPRIPPEASSRFKEVNDAALQSILRAAKYFPPLPKRYPKDEITFIVPVRLAPKSS